MILYRPVRGGLKESMQEVMSFDNYSEMKKILSEKSNDGIFPAPMFLEEDIIISEETHNDDRIDWKNIRHICVKRYGNRVYDSPQCIGYIVECTEI